MKENPENVWKKPWKGRRGLLLWFLITVIAAFVVFFCIGIVTAIENRMGNLAALALLLAVVFAVAGVLAVAFVRWLCHWRNFRRFLFVFVCFITLIALFYAEEDWRGKSDWNQFKSKWEAQGEGFDRASVIPPPVPDDENFALTPIWIESITASLRSPNWFGGFLPRRMTVYGKNGTNFVNRLEMSIYRKSDWNNTNAQVGEWERAIPTDLKSFQTYYRIPEPSAESLSEGGGTNEFPTASQPQSPAADVLLALSKYDSAIEALRQASRLPDSRFPLNYDSSRPWEILLPHLSMLRDCARVLSLRAVAELEYNQSKASGADIGLMLYLVSSVRSEPFLITQLVRLAMVQNTLQPIWRGLAEHKWSEAELIQLDQELSKLDFLAAYQLGQRGEMVLCDIPVCEYLRQHPEQIFDLDALQGKTASPSLLARIAGRLIPDGWIYQNQLCCARVMVEDYLALADVKARTVSPTATRRANEAVTEETKHPGFFNYGERMLLPSLGRAVERFAYAQESVDLARVAIALECYRLAHGEYPATLEPLAPKFIPELPHDIINGQPLHYHRTADGQFVLYSVGWNEKDDGGTVALTKGRSPRLDINEGDWVWRYPAK